MARHLGNLPLYIYTFGYINFYDRDIYGFNARTDIETMIFTNLWLQARCLNHYVIAQHTYFSELSHLLIILSQHVSLKT